MFSSSMIIRAPPKPGYRAAPSGTSQDLFVPAMHVCNETAKAAFLKRNPDQGNTSDKQKKIHASLVVVHDVLKSVGLPTILEGGSLLGFYRNCDVIPTDADGDVSLLGHWLQGKASIENLVKEFAKVNGTLHTEMCPEGPSKTGCETRVVFEDSSYIDLFVFATLNKCDKAPCTFYNSLWPHGTVGPYFIPCVTNAIAFEQASFLDRTFWIPTPTLPYLKNRYGEAWTDPGGGVYKSCRMKEQYHPTDDSFGKAIPPPDYVLSLEEGAKERVDKLLKAGIPEEASIAEEDSDDAADDEWPNSKDSDDA